MKPALSVIFFTVLSGAGYGLWCLLGAGLAADIYPSISLGLPITGVGVLVPLVFGFLLTTAGLLSSTAHLGRPERAWRAVTQWRSSWLSREGVASLVTYLPMLAVAGLAATGSGGVGIRIAGGVLAACCVLTVVCTANIYRSLRTIRAWRLPQVLPLYLMFGLLSGGLWLWTWLALAGSVPIALSLGFPLGLLALAIAAAAVKADYWRCVDRLPKNTAGHAIGLESLGAVRAFEGPVTEESYLTHEMAFVLARKHGARLRKGAIGLFALLPVAGIAVGLFTRVFWADFGAAIACIAGLFIERWLFFAEARHAVAAYFPQRGG